MSYTDEINNMRNELRTLYKTIPEATAGFGALSKAVKQDGALGLAEKECIAVGIAVAQHCSPCINFHIEALIKAGGSREQLADTLAMALQMGGGPALMYAGHALACWDELAARA